MPEGSPPPSACLNKKEKQHRQKYSKHQKQIIGENNISDSLNHPKKRIKSDDSVKKSSPMPTPTIVYTADSILRNLKKESIAFVPTAVRHKSTALKHSSASKKSKENTVQTPTFKPRHFTHINPAPDVQDDL